jgi:hypothetical protein
VPSATEVLQKLNGTKICDKEMVISYAKEKSDLVAKRDGTFVPADVRAARDKKKQEKTDALDAAAKEAEESAAKRAKISNESSSSSSEPMAPSNPFALDPNAPPSRILIAPSLPLEVSPDMLQILFSQYNGFVNARSPKAGVGIIEFSGDGEARVALEALKGFKLTPTVGMELGYGRAE